MIILTLFFISCSNPIKSYSLKSYSSKPAKNNQQVKTTTKEPLHLNTIFIYKDKQFQSNGSMDLEDAIRDAYDGNSRDNYRYTTNRNYRYGWDMTRKSHS